MNPYVFIVGCPRSGTTLLQRILNAHPQIAVLPETHWLRTFFHARIGMTNDGYVDDEMILQLASHPRFHILQMEHLEISALLSTHKPIRFAEFVSLLFDHYGEKCGKQFVGDKTPGYIRDMLLFHRLWPQARFVHLIRDGRNVALSAIPWTETDELSRYPDFATRSVETAALWWETYVRFGREARDSLGGEFYFEIRYETLMNQPQTECYNLCRFLRIPYSDAMLAVPLRTQLRHWESQMKPEDQENFEAASGDLLDELGYRRRFTKVADEKKSAALRIRSGIVHYLRANGLRVPTYWRSLSLLG